jgi:hypothetical protein
MLLRPLASDASRKQLVIALAILALVCALVVCEALFGAQ